MDYPLSTAEFKEIEYCVMQSSNFRIPGKIASELEYMHPHAVEFLFNYGFLVNNTPLKGGTTDWCKDGRYVKLSCSKEEAIKEIKRCNNKAKLQSRREWKIGISSAVIGGLLGVIGTLISANISG